MDTHLSRLVDRFDGMQVVVIGEAMLDTYLEGPADRLCREAPVPVVSVRSRRDAPGGAANTAANLRRLGAHVAFLSATGDDAEGDVLRHTLESLGVRTAHLLAEPSRQTLAKQRVLADGQMLLRFDQGSTGPVDTRTEEELIERLAALVPRSDAVIVSDYGYGILTPRLIQALASLQSQSPRVLVVDSKDLTAYRQARVTAAKPNYDETVRLLGCRGLEEPAARFEQIVPHGHRLLAMTGARMCAVTLDADGAVIFERGHPLYRTYARRQPHSRTAGAGDTFGSALALALAAGADTPAAAELASAAAAIVISREGTLTCSAQDLREYVSAGGKGLPDTSRLAARADLYRQQGRRIVFTNGCFDILHRGHVTFLNQAKALGDVLIVGVNTDASIQRLKGPGRPINALDDRLHVLAALSSVDHLIPFDEDSPDNLIRAVRPDVFVKGGDYTLEQLPEASLVEALGGMVEVLPYVADRSTTRVVERIREGFAVRSDADPPDGTAAHARDVEVLVA
jgi:D-beta-D-heptose 7-phosphate kinase/D-beta-D-heptose 1-phosphate adenosyltransferase